MNVWLTDFWACDFLRNAVWGILLVSVSCGLTGGYIVKRRMAFLGDAMAHGVLPGVALAWMAGVSLFWGGLAAGFVMALLIGWIAAGDKIREDAAIGVVFTSLFAGGVVLMSGQNSYRDFQHLLLGNILGVTEADLCWLALSAVAVAGVLFAFHKELELTTYDPEYAETLGISPTLMRMLLLGVLAFAVVSAIQAVGVVLTGAMLVTPALTAGLLSRRFYVALIAAPAIGAASGLCGLVISYFWDLPSGAMMVLCGTAFFVATRLFRAWREKGGSVSDTANKGEMR